MTTHFGTGALGLYAISLSLYIWYLYFKKRLIGRAATLFLAGGIVLQYFALLERSRWLQSVPYEDLYGSMSLFGWLLAVTYLGLEIFHRHRSVGPFVLPFALHVTLNILAYAAFALSFVLSVIYLLQNRLLRHHRLGTMFWQLPALEVLERMSRSSVIVGMVSLGVGMVLGFVWASRIRGQFWNADAKEIVTLVIFAAYASYVWLGRTSAWRGARASRLCVLNFIFVIFSYTVVNLFLSRYHRYF